MGFQDAGENLADRWQRDWAWLANCPPLVEGPGLPQEILKRWRAPLEDLTGLESFFDPESSPRARNRVGFYTEALVEAALRSIPGVEGIQHSVPIREETRTLGELDFLFEYEGELLHLEVALKFYLYSATEERLGSHYIGPNAGDTLEKKAGKLLGHQLPLGKNAFPEISASHLFCPGILFYHPEEDPPGDPLGILSPSHRRGAWLRANEFRPWVEALAGFTAGEILLKPFWLGCDPHQSIGSLLEEVDRHFAASSLPMHLTLVSEERASDPLRVFVVDPGWPNQLPDSKSVPPR